MFGNIAATILIRIVKIYRRFVSPWIPPRCRYYPSCSEYALISLQKYHVAKASFKIFLRLTRCNPLFPGGEDLP